MLVVDPEDDDWAQHLIGETEEMLRTSNTPIHVILARPPPPITSTAPKVASPRASNVNSRQQRAPDSNKVISKIREQQQRVVNNLLEQRRRVLKGIQKRRKRWLSSRTRQVADWAEQQSWAQGFYHVTLPRASVLRNGKLREDLESCGFGRLARLLTGTAVGLVLGGGGSRGLAHLGVIAALEEAGVVVDMVSGTSQVRSDLSHLLA